MLVMLMPLTALIIMPTKPNAITIKLPLLKATVPGLLEFFLLAKTLMLISALLLVLKLIVLQTLLASGKLLPALTLKPLPVFPN